MQTLKASPLGNRRLERPAEKVIIASTLNEFPICRNGFL